MAASLNKVMLIGNVGDDPTMRFTSNGKPTTTFRVATNRRYKNGQGEVKEDTEWFSIVCWGKLAELCNQYLQKGRLVYVEGRNKTRSWDGQDGQKHYRTEVVASTVSFLGKAGEGKVTAEVSEPDDDGEDIDPDGIPF
jgi:single-strand DNA-binding protein